MKLCTFEKNVILAAARKPQIGPEEHHITGWGAGVGACLGPLKRAGYMKAEMIDGVYTYSATPEGLIAAQDNKMEK